jgi:hypothetical protein
MKTSFVTISLYLLEQMEQLSQQVAQLQIAHIKISNRIINNTKMKTSLFIMILAFIVLSCTDSGTSPEDRDFNVKLRYGIGARNELNTFQNTYTKDLILDGTIIAPFLLSDEELHQIRNKMDEIGFISYPDTFVAVTTDTISQWIEPHATYDFKVKLNSSVKYLYWNDAIINQNAQAIKLRELTRLIRTIIESKPEYSRLPPARGGYM